MIKPYGRAALRTELMMSFDSGDVIEWANSIVLALCEILDHVDRRDLIPVTAQYQRGIFGPDMTEYPLAIFFAHFENQNISAEDFGYWLRVMLRFYSILSQDQRMGE